MQDERPYPNLWQSVLLLIVLLVFQLGFSIIYGIIMLVTMMLRDPSLRLEEPAIAGEPIGMGLTLLAAYTLIVLWGWLRAGKPFGRTFPLSAFPYAVLLPLFLVIVGYNIICSEVDNLTRSLVPMPRFLYELFGSLAAGALASLFLISLVAPVVEELVFRGLILGGLLAYYKPWKAILVSAVLFTLFHLNPYQFVAAFGLGLLFGWVFWKTRSLWPCMILHAIFNGWGWLVNGVLQLDIPGYTKSAQDMANQVAVESQPVWFNLLGCFLVAVGLLLAFQMLRARPEAPLAAPCDGVVLLDEEDERKSPCNTSAV
jgi:hypothetical protein